MLTDENICTIFVDVDLLDKADIFVTLGHSLY